MREGTSGHVHRYFCSVVAALEEPSLTSEGSVRFLNEPVRGTSDVEGTEGRGGRDSKRLRSRTLPPVGPGRNQQDPRMDAKSPGESRESGAVLEETAPSREPQAS